MKVTFFETRCSTPVSEREYVKVGGNTSCVLAQADNGKVFVYCTDVEHGDEIDPGVVELSKDADLLVHDAQYTPRELKGKKGWGHSSWEQAAMVADMAAVKRLALFHHDPEHTDSFLFEMEKDCKTVFSNAFLAIEGETVEI